VEHRAIGIAARLVSQSNQSSPVQIKPQAGAGNLRGMNQDESKAEAEQSLQISIIG
jgi:hypothetical protein